MYRNQLNSNSTVDQCKAHLAILCSTHVKGKDFTKAFAPVARLNIVRTILVVAVTKGWELHHMNVHNAFLHDDLVEEVYMKLPPGFHLFSSKSSVSCSEVLICLEIGSPLLVFQTVSSFETLLFQIIIC